MYDVSSHRCPSRVTTGVLHHVMLTFHNHKVSHFLVCIVNIFQTFFWSLFWSFFFSLYCIIIFKHFVNFKTKMAHMYKHNFFTLKITEYSIFILYNIYIKYLQTNLYDYGYVVKKKHTHTFYTFRSRRYFTKIQNIKIIFFNVFLHKKIYFLQYIN